MCGTAGAACGTMLDCCSGVTCPRFVHACQLGDIGDPCRLNADCLNGLVCNGAWCTTDCLADSDCGLTNYCIADSAGAMSCFPFCSNNAECAIYGGTSCKTGTDPDGLMLPVCSQ